MVGKLCIKLLELYRKYISPLKMPCCKYYPSCSQYAIDAVSRYGVIKGGFMATWRVLRCNPFSHGGFDPVR
jgi:putative membrane protein insertion efficiency factor